MGKGGIRKGRTELKEKGGGKGVGAEVKGEIGRSRGLVVGRGKKAERACVEGEDRGKGGANGTGGMGISREGGQARRREEGRG